MDFKMSRSYEAFYYRALSFDDAESLKKFLHFHKWYFNHSPLEVREQLEKLYFSLKEREEKNGLY